MNAQTDQIARYQAARKELEAEILSKVEKIKEKVLTHNYATLGENIEVLVMVNDELEDVLLNWDVPNVTSMPRSRDLDLDDDELDEDDD